MSSVATSRKAAETSFSDLSWYLATDPEGRPLLIPERRRALAELLEFRFTNLADRGVEEIPPPGDDLAGFVRSTLGRMAAGNPERAAALRLTIGDPEYLEREVRRTRG